MTYTKCVQFDDLFEQQMNYPPTTPEGDSASLEPDDSPARSLPGGGGVYLLTDAEDRLIQLSSAGDLRRALRGRLMATTEDTAEVSAFTRRRAKLGEIVRKIRWRADHSMFEINYDYHRIARVLLPDTYLKNIAFGPAWFVHVDPTAEIPRFAAGKILRSPPGIDLGPFATQKDATRFVQILEDAFDLCRYYHIIEQAPQGQPCAYHEMGRCPAPCAGYIPMPEYRRMISAALAFACGQREELYSDFHKKMNQASQDLAFEQAGLLKQRLERARSIEHDSFKLVRPIEDFNYLIVQRGVGRTQVKPFFVRAGQITPGKPAKIKNMDQVAADWLAEMGKPEKLPSNEKNQQQLRSEQIWLLSHYLFKRDPPGLFLHASVLENSADLAEQVKTCFAVKPREKPATDDHPSNTAND